MNEKEVLAAINEGDSAYGILIEHSPKIERKFNRLCKSIIGLLDEIKEDFPDANYYTASGGFNLLLGQSHSDMTNISRAELVALSGTGVHIGDGDF